MSAYWKQHDNTTPQLILGVVMKQGTQDTMIKITIKSLEQRQIDWSEITSQLKEIWQFVFFADG